MALPANCQTEIDVPSVVEEANYGQTEIDIPCVVEEMMAIYRCGRTAKKRSGCKIPSLGGDDERDKPDVVCLGPYYYDYNQDPFNWSESDKSAMLVHVLPVDDEQKKTMLGRLVEEITLMENEARDHYLDRTIRMTSKEFVEMLLLDGCYILGKFVHPDFCHGISVCGADVSGGPSLETHSEEVASAASQGRRTVKIQSESAMENVALVRNVFYLVDNQIPFSVLNTIHRVLHEHDQSRPSSTAVVDALARHLQQHLKDFGYSIVHVQNLPVPWHLLHLLHMHFKPTEQPQKANNSIDHVNAGPNASAATATVYRWRTATKYHKTGVSFKKQELEVAGSVKSILDVKLDGNTLCVPPLTVDENTCTMLYNLMMLEQHNPVQLGSYVTAYCLFISQLAGEASDIELLANKGIIVHAMRRDSDAADRLANLCLGIIIDLDERKHNYLHETRKVLEEKYQSRRIKWFALLRRNHFSNPWVLIALVVAFLGFASGTFQSVYTSLSYYNRR